MEQEWKIFSAGSGLFGLLFQARRRYAVEVVSIAEEVDGINSRAEFRKGGKKQAKLKPWLYTGREWPCRKRQWCGSTMTHKEDSMY